MMILLNKKEKVKRCTKCILPATMPFIEFNEHGVCNYCSAYKPKIIGQKCLNKAIR